MPINAVALLVPDYDVGIAFFVGQMGFSLLTDIDQGGGKRWVTVAPPDGGVALLLARAVGDRQMVAVGDQHGGRVGFFLTVSDFDAMHARMIAGGVSFEEAPRSEPYGRVAVWRDPFGNRWDLIG